MINDVVVKHIEFPTDWYVPTTLRKLGEFRRLPHGWRYGDGVPSSEATIEAAMSLYDTATRRGFTESDAFPGVNGEIRITFCRNAYYYELTVEADGTVSYVLEYHDIEVDEEDGLSINEAKAKLYDISEDTWTSFDLFTSASGIGVVNDFRAHAFHHPQTDPESPSSARIVYEVPGTASASTLPSTTLKQRILRQSSGEYRPITYP